MSYKYYGTLIMYHGTSVGNAKSIRAEGFLPSEDGMLGRGVYLSRDLEKAMKYANDLGEPGVVIEVKVNVGKVKRINKQGHKWQKTWHDHGYDTAWVPAECGMVKSGLEENCIWDPERITIRRFVYDSGFQEFLTDREAEIKNADMSEDMQREAVDCATQAMEKYNIEKDIAAYIKKEFDKKNKPTWHCVVGSKFGSYVTHTTNHFIYFDLGEVHILLFKAD